MFDKVKNFIDDIFKNKKTGNVILVLGIIGILLIAFSNIIFGSGNKKVKNDDVSFDAEEYIYEIENKTKKLISSIDGAGKCKIMITLEESQEIEIFYDKSKSNDSNRNEEENKLVVIKGENGEDKYITQKIIEPKIRGVLILAEGGGDSKINETITQAVKTLLGIPSNKICVTKLK